MTFEEMFLDVALPEEKVQKLVRPGDPVTFRARFAGLQNSLVSGKALDDRAGVVAMALSLKLLKENHPAWDVYAVATAQEEVSGLGALASAWSFVPDIAVIVETAYGTAPDVNEREGFELGKGPALGMGMTIHHGVTRKLREAAQKVGVPYQIEAGLNPGGKDAVVIQLTKEGIPTGVLSIPVRYMHTPVEVASLEDIQGTANILQAFAADLSEAL
jgi:endoglucanase